MSSELSGSETSDNVIINTREPNSPSYTYQDDSSENTESSTVQKHRATQKNREYMDEKLSNMIVFLRGVTDIDGNKIPEVDGLIDSVNTYKQNYYKFIEMIKRAIKPFECDLDGLMNRYLGTWGIDTSILKPDDKNKVKRYLALFCKFVR